MSKKLQEAKEILSDPTFDVESFITNINIHYQNIQIVKALGKDASIILNLIDRGNYQFLEIAPEIIDIDIFNQMHSAGYEVFYKMKTLQYRKTSYWYGVIIRENLGINYRRLGYYRKYNSFFTVLNSEKAVKEAKIKWKRQKLYRIGTSREEPELPVYRIRRKLWDFAYYELGLPRGRDYYRPTNSVFAWRYYRPTNSVFAWRYFKFILLQAGKNYVRVKVTCQLQDALVKDNAIQKKTHIELSKKFKIDDPHLCLKILDWASKATRKNKTFRVLVSTKLDSLLKKAGLDD